MEEVIVTMLNRYQCRTRSDYENALKEIIQEIALLGLWRQKFFEHALFYGGTALRILYGLPRFSEDLDFSLLKTNRNFDFSLFHQAIKDELNSFGFSVTIKPKNKKQGSQINSAFIKTDTKEILIELQLPELITHHIQKNEVLKIKMETAVDPPKNFETEVKNLLQPTTFQVKTMPLPHLFAGKLYAVIARKWKNRVKGRDFYDLVWYVSRDTEVYLPHLKARLIQSGHWPKDKDFSLQSLNDLLGRIIKSFDINSAKREVAPFLKSKEKESLEVWNRDFFLEIMGRIRACSAPGSL